MGVRAPAVEAVGEAGDFRRGLKFAFDLEVEMRAEMGADRVLLILTHFEHGRVELAHQGPSPVCLAR
jgi:hypothetical protein